MADDTYMNDTGQQVYKSFDIKRSQAYAHCKSSSKITKVKCFSPTGDMRLAPADIAGSAHHPLGPLPGIKLVGCYLGRGDWPSIQAAQACPPTYKQHPVYKTLIQTAKLIYTKKAKKL